MAWWHTSFDEWVCEVRSLYGSQLRLDARFPDANRLLMEFEKRVKVWFRSRNCAAARCVQEKVNELAAAAALLSNMAQDQTLHYELPLIGTNKTIDFLVKSATGLEGWIDVKTVAPQWLDTEFYWQRFERDREHAPQGVRTMLSREWGGAGIANQKRRACRTFVRNTIDIEGKAAELDISQRAPVAILFCTYGQAWKYDLLEDFADFYRTGSVRGVDGFSNAIVKECMSLQRNLAGFHYLERREFDAEQTRFGMFLEGPSVRK